MSLPQGIDFRATSGYVTDPADHTYEISITANYPRTTAQGNNVGWETSSDSRNRSTSPDARLAGAHRTTGTTVTTYRIDLPATGDYKIRLAAGDYSYSAGIKVEIFDTTTSLGIIADTSTTASQRFRDATDAEHTAANWPANNASVTKTFASTILRAKVGDTAGGGGVIACLYVEAASVAAALVGSAAAQAAAIGALSTGIPFAGQAAAVVVAGGVLTSQIQLSGTALAQAEASAALSSGVSLSGAAVSVSFADGALTTQISLDGTAIASAAAAGALDSSITLAGSAAAQADAVGAFDGGAAALAGLASGQAAASGDLTALIKMVGAATADAAVAGALDTLISLSGQSAAQATATGALAETGSIPSLPQTGIDAIVESYTRDLVYQATTKPVVFIARHHR